MPTRTTIPRTEHSPLGPLATNKTTHHYQYLYGGELSWWRSYLDMHIKASLHYTTQQSYNSTSHEQSWEQTPHTTGAESWATKLAHAHFTFCHSKCVIEVHDQSWKFDISNPHDGTQDTVLWLANLWAWWCHACVTIPVAESWDRELRSVRRSLVVVIVSQTSVHILAFWSIKIILRNERASLMVLKIERHFKLHVFERNLWYPWCDIVTCWRLVPSILGLGSIGNACYSKMISSSMG